MDRSEKKVSRRTFVRAAGASAAAVAGMAAGASGRAMAQPAAANPTTWDLTADVVVIGSGAAGLPAAIRAADAGASVIVVEANYDIGGHAITSGGNNPLGGGTSAQKKYKIEDSPDLLFKDLTDWTILETSGMPEYRFNDRGVQRALADNEAPTYEFLVANGVPFNDAAPNNSGGHAVGISAPRENHTTWTKGQSAESPSGAGGTNHMRPLEASARKKGVKFLLNYHMDVIFREQPASGRVLGIQASYTPTILPGTTTPLKPFVVDANNLDAKGAKTVTVKANKGVVIATGGSSGNVSLRRIYDPRLTDEIYCAAAEYSPQDGSGELAALAIGATLWGTANQAMDRDGSLRKRPIVGTPTNYVGWTKDSPIFPKVGATGLRMSWDSAIIVNQAGKRFYNEMEDGYPNGTHQGYLETFAPYVHGNWRNIRKITFNPENYVDAALAINELSQAPDFSAGPQWAIFDASAAERLKFVIDDTTVKPKFFFSANTLAELAAKVSENPHQKAKMPPANLEATVKRYNMMVDLGADPDFDKPSPKYKIEKPPFYAAWATFVTHDTYAGLRIGMKCEVIDMNGKAIAGLFCAGETAAGSCQHGLGRCTTQGYIAGGAAAAGTAA